MNINEGNAKKRLNELKKRLEYINKCHNDAKIDIYSSLAARNREEKEFQSKQKLNDGRKDTEKMVDKIVDTTLQKTYNSDVTAHGKDSIELDEITISKTKPIQESDLSTSNLSGEDIPKCYKKFTEVFDNKQTNMKTMKESVTENEKFYFKLASTTDSNDCSDFKENDKNSHNYAERRCSYDNDERSYKKMKKYHKTKFNDEKITQKKDFQRSRCSEDELSNDNDKSKHKSKIKSKKHKSCKKRLSTDAKHKRSSISRHRSRSIDRDMSLSPIRDKRSRGKRRRSNSSQKYYSRSNSTSDKTKQKTISPVRSDISRSSSISRRSCTPTKNEQILRSRRYRSNSLDKNRNSTPLLDEKYKYSPKPNRSPSNSSVSSSCSTPTKDERSYRSRSNSISQNNMPLRNKRVTPSRSRSGSFDRYSSSSDKELSVFAISRSSKRSSNDTKKSRASTSSFRSRQDPIDREMTSKRSYRSRSGSFDKEKRMTSRKEEKDVHHKDYKSKSNSFDRKRRSRSRDDRSIYSAKSRRSRRDSFDGIGSRGTQQKSFARCRSKSRSLSPVTKRSLSPDKSRRVAIRSRSRSIDRSYRIKRRPSSNTRSRSSKIDRYASSSSRNYSRIHSRSRSRSPERYRIRRISRDRSFSRDRSPLYHRGSKVRKSYAHSSRSPERIKRSRSRSRSPIHNDSMRLTSRLSPRLSSPEIRKKERKLLMDRIFNIMKNKSNINDLNTSNKNLSDSNQNDVQISSNIVSGNRKIEMPSLIGEVYANQNLILLSQDKDNDDGETSEIIEEVIVEIDSGSCEPHKTQNSNIISVQSFNNQKIPSVVKSVNSSALIVCSDASNKLNNQVSLTKSNTGFIEGEKSILKDKGSYEDIHKDIQDLIDRPCGNERVNFDDSPSAGNNASMKSDDISISLNELENESSRLE